MSSGTKNGVPRESLKRALEDGRTAPRIPGDILAEKAFPVRLCSFSALDSFLGLPPLPYTFVETYADVAALARIFEELRFPGVDLADAAVEEPDGRTWYFRCRDPEELYSSKNSSSCQMLSLTQDFTSRRFFDSLGIYPEIRKLRDLSQSAELPWWEGIPPDGGRFRVLMEGALILARYEGTKNPPAAFDGTSLAVHGTAPPGPESQRILLSGLMVSPRPDRGLDFLRRTGLLETLWPELAALDNVDHSKEFHPEGNVWKHTLETFRHRKPGFSTDKASTGSSYDLRLSLGLLLHDIGKPLAASYGGRRFDGHAELGAKAARRFLERLEFAPPLVEDVYFLVRNHMLPAAISRLPLTKTVDALDSPLFPLLLELYRCDESSSFKSPEGYYESSAAYRTYLRNTRNPYRSADGKVLGKGMRSKGR